MHYNYIMDTNIIAEISNQLLSRIHLPIQLFPLNQSSPYPLPNRRTTPPQEWLLRMKPRLTQQINAFILTTMNQPPHIYIDNNVSSSINNTLDLDNIPTCFKHILSHLTSYKPFFKHIFHDKRLTYRVSKFILATNGLISMFTDAFNSDAMDIDTDVTWIFFISIIYGILDHNIDTHNSSTSNTNAINPTNPQYNNTDNIPTHDLYTYLYTLLNNLPQPDITYLNYSHGHQSQSGQSHSSQSHSYNLLTYITTLWHQIKTPSRTIAAIRALQCEYHCWQLQTKHLDNKYNISRTVVTHNLIEKGVSTVLLFFRPRRSTTIRKWRQLYWVATLTQLIDDASDATEDLNDNIASTTGLALCNGDIPTYLAATLDTISYVYYNIDIFDSNYRKLAIFHQVVLYGSIKNIKANPTCGLRTDWLASYVYPNFVLDLDTLQLLKQHKQHILQVLLQYLSISPPTTSPTTPLHI